MAITASYAAGDGSASAIIASPTIARDYHVLAIDGYSRTKVGFPKGKHIKSRSFLMAGRTWHIEYYPNGHIDGDDAHISLFLTLEDRLAADAGVKVHVGFSFLDEVDAQTPAHLRSVAPAKNFTAASSSWGRTFFCKRKDLERSKRLRGDCFVVRCDVIISSHVLTKEIMVPAAVPFVAVPPPDWPEHLRGLLSSGHGADVRFCVGGETFAAHRFMLAARSPVFKAELFGTMKESVDATNGIQIDDMRPDVFKILLHFIYTDSLPEPETKGENKDVEAAMAQHLLVAADWYGMERLKLICEDTLCRHVDVSTAATTLALAEQHCCNGLKKLCLEFIKSPKNFDAVIMTDGFEHLSLSCPTLLREHFMSK